MIRNNKRDSNEVVNGRNTHEVMESDTEDFDEGEKDGDADWQEKFLKLRKIKSNLRIEPQKSKKICEKRKKQIKEKEEEERLHADECRFFNEQHNCYNNSIREERNA